MRRTPRKSLHAVLVLLALLVMAVWGITVINVIFLRGLRKSSGREDDRDEPSSIVGVVEPAAVSRDTPPPPGVEETKYSPITSVQMIASSAATTSSVPAIEVSWSVDMATFKRSASLASYRVARDIEKVPDEERCRDIFEETTLIKASDASLTCLTRGPPHGGIASMCMGRNLALDPNKIRVSAGGEDVRTVMGRSEDEETAHVELGAFRIASRLAKGCEAGSSFPEPFATRIRATSWLREALISMCSSSSSSGEFQREAAQTLEACEGRWDDTPTLLVHRYEYANVFHTGTELVSAYQSVKRARERGLFGSREGLQIVWLDGHAEGSIDEVWSLLFRNPETRGEPRVIRVGRARGRGPLCLRRFVIAMTGYSADVNLHPGDQEFQSSSLSARRTPPQWCVSTDLVGFSRYFVNAMGFLPPRASRLIEESLESDWVRPVKPTADAKVLFIIRDTPAKPTHPRVRDRIERSLHGDAELEVRASDMRRRGIDVELVRLSRLSFVEQVRLMRSARVIITVHGAALTHMIWCRRETMWVELAPNGYTERIHFVKMAARMGLGFARFFSGGAGLMSAASGMGDFSLNPTGFESLVHWSLLVVGGGDRESSFLTPPSVWTKQLELAGGGDRFL